MGFFDRLLGRHPEAEKPSGQPSAGHKTADELSGMLPPNQAETTPPAAESAMASPDDMQKYAEKKAQEPIDNAQAQKDKLNVLEANSGEMKVVKPADRYGGREMAAPTGATAEVPPVSDTPPTSTPETAPRPTDISGITAPPTAEKPISPQPEAAETNPAPSTPEDTPSSDDHKAA